MQPQTRNAITIAQKIPSCICCIVFSVAQHHYSLLYEEMLATAASAVLKMFPPADWNWVSA
jgi:hypothetical protein